MDLDGWMEHALTEARAALEHEDVPVGAVIVDIDSEQVIAARHTQIDEDRSFKLMKALTKP